MNHQVYNNHIHIKYAFLCDSMCGYKIIWSVTDPVDQSHMLGGYSLLTF